jgi:hypothetical protein
MAGLRFTDRNPRPPVESERVDVTGRAAALRALAAVTAILAWPGTSEAYRPFTGTDAAVAGRGDVELELGPVQYLQVGKSRALEVPTLVVNWGFARDWEAVLEGTQLVALGDDAGERRFRVEGVALAVKYVLREGTLQERSGPSVALETSVLLPTLEGEKGAGLQAALIASRRWDPITVHLNGALIWTRVHTLGGFGSVILEGHDAWPVRPVAEVLVAAERLAPTTVSGLAGAIWRFSEPLSFDAALVLARIGPVHSFEIRAGLTWDFGVGFPR